MIDLMEERQRQSGMQRKRNYHHRYTDDLQTNTMRLKRKIQAMETSRAEVKAHWTTNYS
jgi:hypothetical protein